MATDCYLSTLTFRQYVDHLLILQLQQINKKIYKDIKLFLRFPFSGCINIDDNYDIHNIYIYIYITGMENGL